MKVLYKIEKVLFYIFMMSLGLALGAIFGTGFEDDFQCVKFALSYSIGGLFMGGAMKAIVVSLLIITILGFVGYWMHNSIKVKKYSFGPMYLVLFFILFLFSNGYYNTTYFNKLGFYCMIASTIVAFIAMIYCLIVFFVSLKDEHNE